MPTKDDTPTIEYYGKVLRDSLYEGAKLEAQQVEQQRIKEAINATRGNQLVKDYEQQEADKAWNEFYKRLQAFSEETLRGYDNFPSAFMSMVAQQEHMNEAIKKSKPFSSFLNFALDTLQVRPALIAALEGLHKSNTLITLPTLHYYVDFTEEEKLDLSSFAKSVKRADGVSLTHEQQTCVKEIFTTAFLTSWLDKCGYEIEDPNRPNLFVKKDDKTPLTKEVFDSLYNDEENGLSVYINNILDIPTKSFRP